MVTAVQVWNPDDWEGFASALLQARHGPLNIQKIPAEHKGDWGIDYYCVAERVAYQCYAVVEPVDIATRADRQKNKITIDLGKLAKNASQIGRLFLGKKIRYWNLLVPRHDSKEVNLHCAKKTLDIRAKRCPHLDLDIEVNVQAIDAFPGATAYATLNSTLSLNVQATQEELAKWKTGASPDLLENAHRKLGKRASGSTLDDAVAQAARAFLEGNALLDAIRSRSPELHDKISAALTTRARRLSVAGPSGGPDPGAILNTELDRLVIAVKEAVPNLSEDNAQQIALGTAADWIMRCPLDFPPYDR